MPLASSQKSGTHFVLDALRSVPNAAIVDELEVPPCSHTPFTRYQRMIHPRLEILNSTFFQELSTPPLMKHGTKSPANLMVCFNLTQLDLADSARHPSMVGFVVQNLRLSLSLLPRVLASGVRVVLLTRTNPLALALAGKNTNTKHADWAGRTNASLTSVQVEELDRAGASRHRAHLKQFSELKDSGVAVASAPYEQLNSNRSSWADLLSFIGFPCAWVPQRGTVLGRGWSYTPSPGSKHHQSPPAAYLTTDSLARIESYIQHFEAGAGHSLEACHLSDDCCVGVGQRACQPILMAHGRGVDAGGDGRLTAGGRGEEEG